MSNPQEGRKWGHSRAETLIRTPWSHLGQSRPSSLPLPPPFLVLLDSSSSIPSLNASLPALCPSLRHEFFQPSAPDEVPTSSCLQSRPVSQGLDSNVRLLCTLHPTPQHLRAGFTSSSLLQTPPFLQPQPTQPWGLSQFHLLSSLPGSVPNLTALIFLHIPPLPTILLLSSPNFLSPGSLQQRPQWLPFSWNQSLPPVIHVGERFILLRHKSSSAARRLQFLSKNCQDMV